MQSLKEANYFICFCEKNLENVTTFFQSQPYMDRNWWAQQGPAKLQSMYEHPDCTQVDLSYNLCTASLLAFSRMISGAGYSH